MAKPHIKKHRSGGWCTYRGRGVTYGLPVVIRSSVAGAYWAHVSYLSDEDCS